MKISNQVANILASNHTARNSDRELLILYMQRSGMDLTAKQIELFREMPSMETIRRTRQKLQEHGKYPADPNVDEARYNKFKATRQDINNMDPEDLLESKGYRVLPWGEG